MKLARTAKMFKVSKRGRFGGCSPPRAALRLRLMFLPRKRTPRPNSWMIWEPSCLPILSSPMAVTRQLSQPSMNFAPWHRVLMLMFREYIFAVSWSVDVAKEAFGEDIFGLHINVCTILVDEIFEFRGIPNVDETKVFPSVGGFQCNFALSILDIP